MTSDEFLEFEDVIDNQIKNKLAMSDNEANAGVLSGNLVYVDAYTRDDGTKVRAYVRRKQY